VWFRPFFVLGKLSGVKNMAWNTEKAKEIIKVRRPQAAFDETKVIIRVDINRIKVLDFGEEVKNQEFKI